MEIFANILFILSMGLVFWIARIEVIAYLNRRMLKRSKSQLRDYAANNKNPNEVNKND